MNKKKRIVRYVRLVTPAPTNNECPEDSIQMGQLYRTREEAERAFTNDEWIDQGLARIVIYPLRDKTL